MPVVERFVQWAEGEGAPVLKELGAAVAFVVEEFVWFATTVDQVATAIAMPLAEMTDALIGFGTVAYDVLTLHFSSIKGDAKAQYAKVVSVIDLCNKLQVSMGLVTARIGT